MGWGQPLAPRPAEGDTIARATLDSPVVAGARVEGATTVLRSTEWDGPAPAVGAVVRMLDDRLLVVVDVGRGPGPGQWRLTCRTPQIIAWQP